MAKNVDSSTIGHAQVVLFEVKRSKSLGIMKIEHEITIDGPTVSVHELQCISCFNFVRPGDKTFFY